MFGFLTETEMMVFARSFILFLVCEILINIVGMFFMITDIKSGTDLYKKIGGATLLSSVLLTFGFIVFGILSLIFFAIF